MLGCRSACHGMPWHRPWHGMAFADRHRIDANDQREARGAHTSYGQTPLTQAQNFDPPSRPCGWVRGLRTLLGNNNLEKNAIKRHGLPMQIASSCE